MPGGSGPEEFDVIVVGGGPAGSATASFLARAGRSVLLLDRARFPREKPCGDGISLSAVHLLGELGVDVDIERHHTTGLLLSSPNGSSVVISIPGLPQPFVCRREVFDNVIFQHAKKQGATAMEGFYASSLVFNGGTVAGVRGTADGKEMEFRAKVVVGADGAGGITARQLNAFNDDEEHQSAALRCYYEGVEGLTGSIELHFVREAMPGYFWIFPLPGKMANVGLGMRMKDVRKNRVNLNGLLSGIVERNPAFRERFRNAKRVSPVRSWLLPLGSRRMKIAGDGYVLVGDAASLVTPFTGEGIANALTSAKCASGAILDSFRSGDFSERSLSAYQRLLHEKLGRKMGINSRLESLFRSPFILDAAISRAHRSEHLRQAIRSAMFETGKKPGLTDLLHILLA
jgi:geranylgeranyl reductase family protein